MGVFIIILILITCMTGVCLGLFHVQEIEIKNQQKGTYLATMQDFYQALSQNVEATRKYRHDLAKHIKTLEILLEKKEEVREYTDNLIKQYERLKKNSYCSDEILDSLLRIKGEECTKKKIPFYVHMEEERFGEIKEIDMVSLIYNLLDNALEANERIEKGSYGIWFSMGRKEK